MVSLTQLIAETSTTNSVKIKWTGSYSTVSIEQSTNDTTYTTVATSISGTYYTISSLTTNILYYFRITPYDSDGNEGSSLTCAVNIPIVASITSFYAGICTQNTIHLYWKGSFYAIQLQYKKSTDTDYTTISNMIYGKNYMLSDLEEETEYNIRICPYDINIDLADDYTTITETTDYTPYLTLVATAASDYITISWTGEATYIKFQQSTDGSSYTNISTINPEYDLYGSITIQNLQSNMGYYIRAIPYNTSYAIGDTKTIYTTLSS